MAKKVTHTKRSFGRLRKLPSGRYQASYTDPDQRVRKAPSTFGAKVDAEAWLTDRRREIDHGLWSPPVDEAHKITFTEYAEDWLKHREIKPRTRELYRGLLDDYLIPQFGSVPVASITADDVRDWYRTLDASTPTRRAHIYGLIRTIMATAAGEGVITTNPAHIRGAGTVKRASRTEPATLDEIEIIANEMPDRYSMMILLAAWCALRFGELTELRRKDIVLDPPTDDADAIRTGIIRVRRAVVRVGGEFVVGSTKSDAGERDVAIPPHLVTAIDAHLAEHVGADREALLFPAQHGGHLAPATLYRRYYTARSRAGRDDLRFHDLRHSGAVLAAQTGATLAELMARLGHSTPAAAMRYQHAARGRDAEIAAALSALAAARTAG